MRIPYHHLADRVKSMLSKQAVVFSWIVLSFAVLRVAELPLLKFTPLPYRIVTDLDPKQSLSEPSGVVFHRGRHTLFLVGDNGDVCEMKTDGTLIRKKHVRTADFEGITYNPETGLLYVAVEGEETILELEPDTFRVRREFAIPRKFQGATVMKAGGQGIEAVTFLPDKKHPHGGTFLVANQSFSLSSPDDRAGIFEIELPLRSSEETPVRILRAVYPGVTDLAGLCYNASTGRLLVVSDVNDLLLDMKPNGEIVSCYVLPGTDQEGIALDDQGFLYIAQDCGGILKLEPRPEARLGLLNPHGDGGTDTHGEPAISALEVPPVVQTF
ncbi:MAG: SdiA-regulated domain-containing protein [Kiritimatiellia bacterium]